MTHPIDTTPEAIAALLDGVTPGPWHVAPDGYRVTDKLVTFDGQGARHGDTPNIVIFAETKPNAHFIAAARDLVPALAADIARLTAALSEAQFERDNNRAKLEVAKSERDTARAETAMAFELAEDAAFGATQPDGFAPEEEWLAEEQRENCCDAIRAITPADASAALAARDAAMRNEGRRQAAEIARSDAQSETGPILRRRLAGNGTPVAASARRRQAIRTAHRILATLEPEGGE